MASKKELYEAAKAAGHDLPAYDDITAAQLQELVGDSDSDGFVVINNRKNPVRCAGVRMAPKGQKGDRVTLTDAQLNDSRLMSKIMHGIETGVFLKG